MEIEILKNNLIGKNKRIIFPEGNDLRIIKSAIRLKNENLANPILLGDEQEILKIIKDNKLNISDISIINPLKLTNFSDYVNKMVELRKGKNTYQECEKMLKGNNYFAVMMLKNNEADAVLSGAVYSTSDTVRPALQILKTSAGNKIVSSCFLLKKEGEKPLIFADCAVNVNPSSNELVEIAKQSVATAKMFNLEPKLAFLSFSSKGSAINESSQKVIDAYEELKKENPDFVFDGELQFDSAFVPKVANAKAPNSALMGDANVFIFPNLDAGNIGYKIAQRLGGYEALGPILQGLSKPINDLSRGCSEEDVYKMSIITLNQN